MNLSIPILNNTSHSTSAACLMLNHFFQNAVAVTIGHIQAALGHQRFPRSSPMAGIPSSAWLWVMGHCVSQYSCRFIHPCVFSRWNFSYILQQFVHLLNDLWKNLYRSKRAAMRNRSTTTNSYIHT